MNYSIIAKSVICALTLLLLYAASACKNENAPDPQIVRISYMQPLGEFRYESDLLTVAGASELQYDNQRRLSSSITSRIDTSYSWFSGVKGIHTHEFYLQYGFLWEGAVIRGMKIDSTFSQNSVNGIPNWPSYATNMPMFSFFYSGIRLDSILCHAPSEFDGISRMIFEYDHKERIIKKTTHGSVVRLPYVFPVRFVQIESAFEYDNYHNPYHLLYTELGTLLPELIRENFSPGNPVKHSVYYQEGKLELTSETKYTYTYNEQGYPTEIEVNPSSAHSTKILRYE